MPDPYRAEITDRGRTKAGVVIHEFPTLGRFIFREDGADEDRTFRTEWWSIRRVTDRENGKSDG